MKKIAEEINNLILLPKKERLISALKSVVSGKEKNYISEIINPKYFEIWFYDALDFNYIIIGKNNFVINLTANNDQVLINTLFERFRTDFESLELAEKEFSKLKKELEFKFFSDCWEELENRIKKKVRCFLIEEGIIRGFDINKREKIEGEKIGEILDKEGIENHF